MSAMGQKQTFAVQNAMSALPHGPPVSPPHRDDSRLSFSATFSTPQLFTPVFTPARFLALFRARHFQQVIAAQALTQFAADCCPLYPRKRTSDLRVHAQQDEAGGLFANPPRSVFGILKI